MALGKNFKYRQGTCSRQGFHNFGLPALITSPEPVGNLSIRDRRPPARGAPGRSGDGL
jgi:hypothetical protein